MNRKGVSGFQADSWSKATGISLEAQGVSHYSQKAQVNYVVDGVIDTHLLGTGPIRRQRSRGGPNVVRRGGLLTRK